MFFGNQMRSFIRGGAGIAALVSILLLASCGGGGGCASGDACSATSAGAVTTGAVTAATAVSVSIGRDGTIAVDAVSSLKYSKKFVVTVVDQDGRPVLGAIVDPRIEMVAYGKGWMERNTTTFAVIAENRTYCIAEDLNNNNILDAGEDLNGDGVITPERSTVAIVPSSGVYKTDATGSVVFELQYAKSHATWIVPALVVKASVTGTEGTAKLDYFTSYAAGDEKLPGAPFVFSPFKFSNSCTDNL